MGEKQSITRKWLCPLTSRSLNLLHLSVPLVVPVAIKDVVNISGFESRLLAEFSNVLTHPRHKKTVLLHGGTDAQRRICEKMIVKEKRFISTTVTSCSRDPLEENYDVARSAGFASN